MIHPNGTRWRSRRPQRAIEMDHRRQWCRSAPEPGPGRCGRNPGPVRSEPGPGRRGTQAGAVARVTSTSPLPVRPRTCSAGACGGVRSAPPARCAPRPEPEERSSSAPHAGCTPIRSPPEPVVRSSCPARASVDRTSPEPVRTPRSRRHLANRDVAAARLDLGGPARPVQPRPCRSRSAPGPGRRSGPARCRRSRWSRRPRRRRRPPRPPRSRCAPRSSRRCRSPGRHRQPARAASREPAGAETVTASGTTRSGSSEAERTTSRRAPSPTR